MSLQLQQAWFLFIRHTFRNCPFKVCARNKILLYHHHHHWLYHRQCMSVFISSDLSLSLSMSMFSCRLVDLYIIFAVCTTSLINVRNVASVSTKSHFSTTCIYSCVTRDCISCTDHQMLLDVQTKEEEMGETRCMHVEQQIWRILMKKPEKTPHLEEVLVHGKELWKYTFKKLHNRD
jgi:hypothetical protein